MTSFLDSKRTVDDRALNKDVVERLRLELARAPRPLSVLEVGAGLGTMIARLVEWNILNRAHYTLLDMDPRLLADSRAWLKDWATRHNCFADDKGDALEIVGETLEIKVEFVEAELRSYLAETRALKVDLLIANAFLDLVDVPAVLPDLFRLLKDGGLFWFTINFDGQTVFQPEHPKDEQFMRTYHQSMDERTRGGHPAGDSRTGRHLFGALRGAGAQVLSAGASDWVVFPHGAGYPDKESYFLHHIVQTIDWELQKHESIDSDELQGWVQSRHRQVEEAELVYLAHQLDFLGRVGG